MKQPTPFRYPKWKHVRRLNPKKYRSYKSYKPYLRDEFDRKCVYCRLPDGLGGTFGVDHYKPTAKFPELTTNYSNLFYACGNCNSRKTDYWPSKVEGERGIFIPNPCHHVMASHLWFEGFEVQPRDAAGQHTEQLLQLNDDELVLFREFIERGIERAWVEARKISQTLKEIAGELKRCADETRTDVLTGASAKLRDELEKIREDLVRLTGDAQTALPTR